MAKKKTNSLAVGFCLDESGSMLSIQQVTIDGFNEYVDDLRKQGETVLSLTMFSSHRDNEPPYREVCVATEIADVPRLTIENYRPEGNTPLLDAIGHTIRKLDDALLAKEKQAGAVIFVIQTDGFENASREFTRKQVQDLIQSKEKAGWSFIYLGANQDEFAAERAAASMGMMAGSSMGYGGQHTSSVFRGVSAGSSAKRTTPIMSSADVLSTTRMAQDKDKDLKKKKK